MAKMQGWTAQCTTLLAYSVFAIIVGSYGAYEHEFHKHSMYSLYAGVRHQSETLNRLYHTMSETNTLL